MHLNDRRRLSHRPGCDTAGVHVEKGCKPHIAEPHPKSRPATMASRSINVPSLWKV